MERIRLAARLSRRVLMTGMVPPTLASKPMLTPCALGGLEDLVSVGGQQGLVGRHHVLSLPDGLENEAFRRLVASDQLDDDGDLRVVQDGLGVLRQELLVHRHRAGRLQIEIGNPLDDDSRPQALLDEAAVFHEQLHGAGADVAEADQPCIDGFHGVRSNQKGVPVLLTRNGARSGKRSI